MSRRRRSVFLVALLVVAAVTPWGRVAAELLPPRPSAVVLITIDTLRADGVSFNGALHRTTPFLDSLAKHAAVFARAYAPSSWTVPSMASLFTSLAPASHGLIGGFAGDRKRVDHAVLPDSITTLAESFREAGWVTVGVPGNRLLGAEFGFAQGFDFYSRADHLPATEVNWRVEEQMHRAFGVDWVERWKDKPVFLWIHYFDPHAPYHARLPWMQDYAPDFETNASAYPIEEMPRRIRKRADFGPRLAPYTRPLYWSEINFVDEQFHRLARRMGIAEDDVLLVVTSDHGEEFLERGELGHGHSLYEELVRVPLLVHWPARFSNAVRVEQEVSLLDVYPTLSTLAGLPNPPRTQGSDLVPQLTNSGTVESRTLVLQLKKGQSDLRAVVQGPWKLIEDQKSGRNALFHLPSDPAEERDVADANPEVTERLRESARSWAADLPPPPDDLRRQTMPDEAMQERLRALGYLPDKDDD